MHKTPSIQQETSDRPYPHLAALPVPQLQAQCEVRHLRRSGPGGQHRNKVETAVQLLHRATGVKAEANERRSQAENLAVALRRLRIELALVIRLPLEPDYQPSPLWRSRCQAGRIGVSRSHEDFPAVLAEALDVLAAHAHQPQPAAAALGSTASQLVRLLQQEPRALALVNRCRAEHQLRRLR
jgi:hypothetical protein